MSVLFERAYQSIINFNPVQTDNVLKNLEVKDSSSCLSFLVTLSYWNLKLQRKTFRVLKNSSLESSRGIKLSKLESFRTYGLICIYGYSDYFSISSKILIARFEISKALKP